MVPSDSTISGSSVSASSATAGRLIPVWQSLLRRSFVGVNDNFFSLGGDFHTADLLFAEIARSEGRELPSATIFHAPTITALASVLEQPKLPSFSPFVQLKAGGEKPPILIAHGLSGCASFSELAKHIQTEHPIYGIQAKGVDGLDEPFDRIEDMAQFYVEALIEQQLQAPYILIGYSFGGLVALEMAQVLSRRQKQIGLLVLIDAYPHAHYLSVGQRLRLGAQRAARHFSEMKQRSIRGALSYLIHGAKRRLRIAGVHGSEKAPEGSRLSLAQTTRHVKDKSYLALARYRPRVYSGEIKFVKSASDTYFPGNPVPVWANLARTLEVQIVPGNHLNIVTTHFEGLAAVLTRYLRESVASGFGRDVIQVWLVSESTTYSDQDHIQISPARAALLLISVGCPPHGLSILNPPLREQELFESPRGLQKRVSLVGLRRSYGRSRSPRPVQNKVGRRSSAALPLLLSCASGTSIDRCREARPVRAETLATSPAEGNGSPRRFDLSPYGRAWIPSM